MPEQETTLPQNPWLAPILAILRQTPGGLSEYALIDQLKRRGLIEPESSGCSDDLALFKVHFMVMNALYQLQEKLLQEGFYLDISPLSIRLFQTSATSQNQGLNSDAAEAELRRYYLDWQHFDNTGESEVDALLNQFWQRFLASDQQQQALEALALTPQASWLEIRQRYQQLIREHHPDKGGDSERFIEIRSAYETLASIHNR